MVTTDGLPSARVIPFQMQRMFQNLLGNPLKFSKKDTQPVITIAHSFVSKDEIKNGLVGSVNQYSQIDVWDNVIGFNVDASEKIFGLFQRLHGRSAYEGSGIGLAICRKIVENHGGIIQATSKVGKGSKFTIILPYGITQ